MSAFDLKLPRMATIRQSLYHAPLGEAEVIASVQREFARTGLLNKIQAGQTIAIGAGSRGIASINLIIRTLVEEVKKINANPFVFPAMGSHGGATAEGQVEMLGTLGITESYIGCSILSSMDVIELGTTARGVPVFLDKNACQADGIIIANRIKAHTNFRGEVESGLMKMLAIGTGKQRQAMAIHAMGADGLRDNIPEVGQALLDRAPVLAGFASIEDGYHNATRIIGVEPENFLRTEIELLKEAKHYMPKLPLKQFDILVVDQIGKNISGSGMDSNVVGRVRLPGLNAFPEPDIQVIIALDMTEESHGNAVGVGLADLTVRRLVNKVDYHATYTNVLTGNGPQHGAIPVTLESDKEAIQTASKYLLPPMNPSDIKMMRIRNTLTLDVLQVSEAVLRQLQSLDGIEIITELAEIEFDSSGSLF
ncbi:lactate racemase domain-containing protein [Candidatus Chlorohelix sp.]|uniref:lactate racemase domain-containing protein n=1 Tax=Candidatus Chlorohelix sp. TaxID=3139201 RepID=UPI003073615A